MNSQHAEALPAPLTSLDQMVQERGQLQPASTISPDSGHSIVHTNSCTLAFCSNYDSFGWNLEDEETTVCPANLHAEAPQFLAIDSPFLSDLVISAQEDPGFDWSSEFKMPHTIEQCFNYKFQEDDESSWLEITKYIDASVFDGDGPQDSFWMAPQSSSRNSVESGDLYKHAAENTAHDFSISANSTPCTPPPISEAKSHNISHSVSLESQPSEVDSSPNFLREAMKDIEVIDLTADDLHASPEPPNPQLKEYSSNGRVVTPRLIFVDLTQDDDDDDDDDDKEKHGVEGGEGTETWYDATVIT